MLRLNFSWRLPTAARRLSGTRFTQPINSAEWRIYLHIFVVIVQAYVLCATIDTLKRCVVMLFIFKCISFLKFIAAYLGQSGQTLSRAQAQERMFAKLANPRFLIDMRPLLPAALTSRPGPSSRRFSPKSSTSFPASRGFGSPK